MLVLDSNYVLALWQRDFERILAGWIDELDVRVLRGREVVARHVRMLDEFLKACDKSVAVSRYVDRDEER